VLFRHKNSKRGADRAAHDAVLAPLMPKDMKIGMIAGPAGMTVGASGAKQMPRDVAIRIENTNLGNGGGGQSLLATPLRAKSSRA